MTGHSIPVDVLGRRRFFDDLRIAIFMMVYDLLFALLRCLPFIIKTSKSAVLARNDDVREVMRRDDDFNVTYAEHLKVVMGGAPFLLGQDGDNLTQDMTAVGKVIKETDIPILASQAAARCAELVALKESIEVVSLARAATQEVFCSYLGITSPKGGDLQVIAMRVIEFVLADVFNDPELQREAARLSLPLRNHIDILIAARKVGGRPFGNDVLGRCLACQADADPWFTDVQIRTLLAGLIYTALPQPPMAVAQSLDQLLRRPAMLAVARDLARANDSRLGSYVFEALRFNPLVPVLARRARSDQVVAATTHRKATIKDGARVFVGLRSAMRDPRRLTRPEDFDPTRNWESYLLFGDGPHRCLAEQVSKALVPAVLGEILKQRGLKRAPGSRGRLLMRSFFADRLWVAF